MGLREYLRREVQGWDPVGEELSYSLDQDGPEMRHLRRYLGKLIIWRRKKRQTEKKVTIETIGKEWRCN